MKTVKCDYNYVGVLVFFKENVINVINVRRLTYKHSRQTLIISVFCVIISPAVLLKMLRKHSE